MKKIKITALGDSLTYGYMIDEEYKWVNILNNSGDNYQIINKGVNGDTTSQMLKRYEKDVAKDGDILLFWGGTNDFFIGKDMDITIDCIEQIRQFTIRDNMDMIVIVPTPEDTTKNIFAPNTISATRTINKKIEFLRKYYMANNFKYIDLYEKFINLDNMQNFYFDELHFNNEGSKLVYEEIKKYLNTIL